MRNNFYGKWLSPIPNPSGLHGILVNHIRWALEWTHCWSGSSPLPNCCQLLKVVVHSYREVGTSLEANVELHYEIIEGQRKIIFGRVIL